MPTVFGIDCIRPNLHVRLKELSLLSVSPQFHTPQYRQLQELLLLLLLKWAPRALEGGPSDRQHLLGVGREDSEWGRRPTQGVLPEDSAASV